MKYTNYRRWRRTGLQGAIVLLLVTLPILTFAQNHAADTSQTLDTAIHNAAGQGDTAKVAALLRGNSALISGKDAYGETPLHWAALSGQKEVVQLLLDNKADVNAKDNDGITPLHDALLNGHNDVADILRQHGGLDSTPIRKDLDKRLTADFLPNLPAENNMAADTKDRRYKVVSIASGQLETSYMLDNRIGRLWIIRGQLSQTPSLIPCVYQLSGGRSALSAVSEVSTSEAITERFMIESAPAGGASITYVIDTQSGRLWIVRGQLTSAPFLIPCVYQLLDGHINSSPVDVGIEINLSKSARPSGTP
jgi:hypothetical protein